MIEIVNEKLVEEGLENATFELAAVREHAKDGAS